MPALAAWEIGFRAAVRASVPSGWAVTPHKGRIRLQVREPGRVPLNQSVVLPYRWLPEESADALMRIRAVVTIYDGSLSMAAEQAAGLSSRAVIDWPGTVEAFRVQRVEKLKVTSSATWAKKYQPPLGAAVAALAARKPPMDAQSLLDVVLARWKPGSRSRQIARQSLTNFLTFAVARQGFPKVWQPPVHEREARAAKREGRALSDAQIIRLVDELPNTPAGHRWRFAVQLLATFGLRPEELRFLKIEDGELKCNYRKAAGPGRRTPPRRLYPLMVRDGDGNPVDWHLADRLAAGESLPPLGQPGKGAEALRTFLLRQTPWKALQEEVAAAGGELVPYAFRHRYAKASHAAGLPVASIAAAMGHTVQVHLQAYARFVPDGVGAAYAMANQ